MNLPEPLVVLYRAMADGDTETLLALLADDFVGHVTDGLPQIGGTHVGPAAMLRGAWGPARMMYGVVPRPTDCIQDSDGRVVVLGRYEGTPPSTGEAFEAAFCHAFRIEKGRVTELRQVTDSMRWLEAVAPSAQNVVLAHRVFDSVRARNLSELLTAYAPDIVIDEDPSLPYGGRWEGHNGAVAHSAGYDRTWSGLQSEAERDPRETIVPTPTGAVALWTLRASRGSDKLSQLAASVFEMTAGRVRRLRMLHFDTAAIVRFLDDENSVV